MQHLRLWKISLTQKEKWNRGKYGKRKRNYYFLMFKLQNLFVIIKKNGTAVDDEVTEKLVIPFSLDADQIDDLLERLTDGGISITDKEGNPSTKYVVEETKTRRTN